MRLNRKWLLAIALVLSLTMAISGTLAYLTDRDSKANVLTFGNVEIELIEEYEPESQFLPGVKVEKEASIKNVGDNDAYVWLTVAVPEQFVVYNPDKPTDASGQHLHWNVPGAFWNGYHTMQKYIDSAIAAGYLPEDSTGVHESDTWILYNGNVGVEPYVTEIDGANYCVSTLLYTGPIEKGETTNIGTSTFYLDQHIDITPDGEMYRVMNGVPTQLGWNVNTDGNPVVYISAYAIQAEGVTDVTKDDVIDVHDAYAMYKGQWGDKGAEYGKEEEEPTNGDDESVNYTIPAGTEYVTVKNSEELKAALNTKADTILLKDGEYNWSGTGHNNGNIQTVNIYGESKNAILYHTNEGEGNTDYDFDNYNVNFYGLTISGEKNGASYPGWARMSATYNDCVIKQTYGLYAGSHTFNYCTLNVTGDQYNIWTWGAENATFNYCTFNSDGKAMLLYGQVNTKLTVNDCVFNDNGGLPDLKAAIEIGNDFNKSYELIVNNTTVNGYEINDKGINTGTTLWGNKNSMGTDKLNVVVDGVDVY